MKSEDLLYALGEVDSAAVIRAGEKLAGKSSRPVRLKAVRVLLVAAALLFALGGIGWGVYQSILSARVPEEGEALVYHDIMYDHDDQAKPIEFQFRQAALVIHVNCDEGSRLCLFKLPEAGGRRNLLSILNTSVPYEGAHVRKFPNIPLKRKEALEQAGMSLLEAGSYGNYWFLHDEEDYNIPALSVELMNACELYGTDLILGWEGGEAEVIQQREDEKSLEMEVFYRYRLETRYLFRYDREMQYLLVSCGDAEQYEFSDLEQIADTLELRQTDLVVSYDESEIADYRTIQERDMWIDMVEHH